MSYKYETEKPAIFTEPGQRQFLSIRDRAHKLIQQAGAARMDMIIADETGRNGQKLADDGLR